MAFCSRGNGLSPRDKAAITGRPNPLLQALETSSHNSGDWQGHSDSDDDLSSDDGISSIDEEASLRRSRTLDHYQSIVTNQPPVTPLANSVAGKPGDVKTPATVEMSTYSNSSAGSTGQNGTPFARRNLDEILSRVAPGQPGSVPQVQASAPQQNKAKPPSVDGCTYNI